MEYRWEITLPILRSKGQRSRTNEGQKVKNSVILCLVGNFYFPSDFNGIFFIGFLSKKDEIGIPSDFHYRLPSPRKIKPKLVKIWILQKFYFSSDFDGVCCKWFLVKNATKVVPKHFFVYHAVFELQGAKRGWFILCRVGNFYFSSDFDGVSFIGFLSKKDEIGIPSDFHYRLPFPRKIGPKFVKNSIFQKILFLIRFRWGLLQMIPCEKCNKKNKSCSQAFFRILCRFWVTRGRKGL